MCRKRAAAGHDGPAVTEHTDGIAFSVNHRFNAERHAGHQPHAVAGLAVIRHLRILVHLTADSVSAVFPYNTVPTGTAIFFHGMGHIAEACPDLCRIDRSVKAGFCHTQQVCRFFRNVAHGECVCRVADESVKSCTHVHADDVALADHAFVTGDTVNDLVVDRNAGTCRKTAVSQKGRNRTAAHDEIVNGFVQLLCCHTGVNYLAGMYQSICSDSACFPQFLYIRFGFNGHTHFTPTAFNTRAVVSATSSCPITVSSLPCFS